MAPGFLLDPEATLSSPDQPHWDARNQAPFAPETPASGINHPGFYRACWYRREFEVPRLNPRERLLLHFGAVDYHAKVWVNGEMVATHEGGYTPFIRRYHGAL